MRTLPWQLFGATLAVSTIASCSLVWSGEPRTGAISPSLDPKLDVIEVVNVVHHRAIAERGKEAKEFYVFKVEFDPSYKRWAVYFIGRQTRLEFESCFRIIVDDTTSATEYRACPA